MINKCYSIGGRSLESYGDSLYWMGMIYNQLFFKYGVPCSKLIDMITVSDMLKQYVTMHEPGLEHTVEHLYEVFIKKICRPIRKSSGILSAAFSNLGRELKK